MPRSVLIHAVGGCLVAVTAAFGAADVRAAAPERSAVIKTYADIAQAAYEDSAIAAKRLKGAVDALVASPSADAMQAARAAWIAARPPYQQTEVFRFGNPIVDDWEGKVNAWPLDEGLIDYVDGGYGTAAPTTRPAGSTPGCSNRCTKPGASRPTSPSATTPSNSCSGART